MAKRNKDVRDEAPRPSDRLPSIEELRSRQKQGQEGTGLDENQTGGLNFVQGHAVTIKE